MKLANARLCLSCDEIYEANQLQLTNGNCPKCLERLAVMLKDYMPILHNHVMDALARKESKGGTAINARGIRGDKEPGT